MAAYTVIPGREQRELRPNPESRSESHFEIPGSRSAGAARAPE
jgi:hypothetical protein